MSISISQAQTAPALEYFCDLKVKLDPALIVGETPHEDIEQVMNQNK
jgi:hypothetical protein